VVFYCDVSCVFYSKEPKFEISRNSRLVRLIIIEIRDLVLHIPTLPFNITHSSPGLQSILSTIQQSYITIFTKREVVHGTSKGKGSFYQFDIAKATHSNITCSLVKFWITFSWNNIDGTSKLAVIECYMGGGKVFNKEYCEPHLAQNIY